MKIISWNLNGLMASIESNSFTSLQELNPDYLCLQEIRTKKEPGVMPGFLHYWNHAERNGYSGTATLARLAPVKVIRGFQGTGHDAEGRIITLEYDSFFLVNVYVPNSQSGKMRQAFRRAWDEEFRDYICQLRTHKSVMICGDFNAVLSEKDFYEENINQQDMERGYISDERSNLETLLECGFTDVYRHLHPEGRSYTWWSNRLHKRSENRGWRLDYFFVSNDLLPRIKTVRHLTGISGSDHCPILLEIDINQRYTDRKLERQWQQIDWKRAEEKLETLQGKLTIATFKQDKREIIRLQRQIVDDLDIRCLAVRHIATHSTVPGVDKVRWQTDGEKMAAALSLNPKEYKASPMRQIIYKQDNYHRARYPKLPTFRDRAMLKLYSYTLIPVTEALADRKSFAFRPGRSQQDAFAYILDAFKGKNPPTVVVCADVKGFYSHIPHKWLLENVPMEKHILEEFLHAGYVFHGELFEVDDIGLSEGFSISPYIANFMLDGLKDKIYKGLHGTERPEDYSDGNLIRFADDMIVTVRSKDKAARVLELIAEFLEERGLVLSPEKTMIRTIDEGFSFLSRVFIRKNGSLYSYPAKTSVDRFISDTCEFILAFQTYRKSHRDFIKELNSKLRGFANYHRSCDAEEAFRRVDAAVQTALLESAQKRHPKMALEKIQTMYWYKEKDGRHCYALPEDKSVRVIRLADTILIPYQKPDIRANPFLDTDYMESKSHASQINNVSGPYKAVWDRQKGRCYYCGEPILPNQSRTTVIADLSRPPSPRNSVYIHKLCELSEVEVVWADKDVSYMRPYDVMNALQGIIAPGRDKKKGPITPKWKYYKLKQHFARCTAPSMTITFQKIEEILGTPLSDAARKSRDWWYPRREYNRMCEAWITEGYTIETLDLKKRKITLRQMEGGFRKCVIPDAFITGKIPDDAAFELESFLDYLSKKYAILK